MNKRNESHQMVIESLTEALLQLMDKKPLSEINISELCNRAGVSRVSFYRNYDSIPDILIQHLSKCTDYWWSNFSLKDENEFYLTFWSELLEQYKKNEKLIKLLYQNKASYILKEQIFSCCGPLPEHNDKDAYTRALLAGAIYGIIEEWIRRGANDFPKDVSIRKLTSAIQDQ